MISGGRGQNVRPPCGIIDRRPPGRAEPAGAAETLEMAGASLALVPHPRHFTVPLRPD